MVALGLALAIAVAGLAALVSLWRAGRGGGLFVLAALPFALLFLAAGTGGAAWLLIRGFQGIAESGSVGVRTVAAFSAHSTRVLLLGVAACAVTVLVAGVLQWLAAGPPDSSTPEIAGSPQRGARSMWILAGCSLLALPAAGLVVRAQSIAPIVLKLAQSVGDGQTPIPAGALAEAGARLETEATVAGLSGALSRELVELSLFSLALGGGLLLAGVIGARAFTATSKPRWIVAWSWIALLVVIAGAVRAGMALSSDLRWFEHASR